MKLQEILQNIVSPIMGAAGLEVDIKTQITPDIHLNIEKIVRDVASGKGSPLIRIIKPKITARSVGGLNYVLAPAGEPTMNYLPAAILIVILTYLLTFYAGFKMGEP